MRRWLIALLVAAFGGLALIYSASQTERYAATAEVMVSPAPASQDLAAALDEFGPSSEWVATQAELIMGRTLAERVVEVEGLSIPPIELASLVSAEVVGDTRLIQVTVTDPDPAFARMLAAAVVDHYVAGETPGTEEVSAEIVETAIASQDPVSPQPLRDGLIGAGAGLVVGLLLSLVRPRRMTPDEEFVAPPAEAWFEPEQAGAPEVAGAERREPLWVDPDDGAPEEEIEADDDADEEEVQLHSEPPEPATIEEMQEEPEEGGYSEFWGGRGRGRRKKR